MTDAFKFSNSTEHHNNKDQSMHFTKEWVTVRGGIPQANNIIIIKTKIISKVVQGVQLS